MVVGPGQTRARADPQYNCKARRGYFGVGGGGGGGRKIDHVRVSHLVGCRGHAPPGNF